MQAVENKEETIRETDLLHFLLRYTTTCNCAVAAWSLPEERSVTIILSLRPVNLARQSSLEDLPAGYLLAPFEKDKEAIFLEADYAFFIEGGVLSAPRNELERKSHAWLKEHAGDEQTASGSATWFTGSQPASFSKQHYLDIVEKGMTAIGQGLFEKVVPSRCKTVELPKNFELAKAFTRLCRAYPHAFVSLTSSAQSGTWMGASPEELVRVFDNTIFKTVALAGTQPYTEGQNLRHVSWTQKEIEEQALVERYIISCFKKIRLREYDEHGPKTVVAGNLMHLRSEFTVNMKETEFPQLGSVMLHLLHPTSAVCGMPLESAREFLMEHEGYDRGFYSGYLGPVNMNREISLFVNLRCMQLTENHAVFYAGAGVTIDSIPEKEWEETEMKMNTLLSLISSADA